MNERVQLNSELNGLLGPLSLVPLLGTTDSLVRASGLLVLLWVVGSLHVALTRLIRPLLSSCSQLLASTLIAASLVSCAELILQAQALALYQGLGIYLALIGIHCIMHGYTSGTADSYPRLIALFSVLMLLLALLRELLGNGTLFSHAQWLFGVSAAHWEINVFTGGLHLALLTPGGFILLALILAAKNAWGSRSGLTTDTKTDRPSDSKETLHP